MERRPDIEEELLALVVLAPSIRAAIEPATAADSEAVLRTVVVLAVEEEGLLLRELVGTCCPEEAE